VGEGGRAAFATPCAGGRFRRCGSAATSARPSPVPGRAHRANAEWL